MAEQNSPVPAFDLNIKTSAGLRRWVNVSVLHMRGSGGELLVVHLIRDIDRKKKLETVTERFLVQVSSLSGQDVDQLLIGPPAPHFASYQPGAPDSPASGPRLASAGREPGTEDQLHDGKEPRSTHHAETLGSFPNRGDPPRDERTPPIKFRAFWQAPLSSRAAAR